MTMKLKGKKPRVKIFCNGEIEVWATLDSNVMKLVDKLSKCFPIKKGKDKKEIV